jgi:hypothetical protein
MALLVRVPIRLDLAGVADVRRCHHNVEADVMSGHHHMW